MYNGFGRGTDLYRIQALHLNEKPKSWKKQGFLVFMKEAGELSETYHIICGLIGRPVEDFAIDILNESIDLYHQYYNTAIQLINKV